MALNINKKKLRELLGPKVFGYCLNDACVLAPWRQKLTKDQSKYLNGFPSRTKPTLRAVLEILSAEHHLK